MGSAVELRRDLCARNLAFAQTKRLAHVLSYGEMPVIVYCPQAACTRHGNFFDPSYAAILKRPDWARRLEKIHPHGRHALPRADRAWRELDSCMSSDALLMNVFCCPRVCSSRAVTSMLGTESTDAPEFGYKARVPLLRGMTDRTEVDMKLGTLLVETKLTENDFQTKNRFVLESYRDFPNVFDVCELPRSGDQCISYQLIRNVLAAYAAGVRFCVIADARRDDLIEAWYTIMRCIRDAEMRTRCKVLTWQELSSALPRRLQGFSRRSTGFSAAVPRSDWWINDA
jgi:hypothetical protein